MGSCTHCFVVHSQRKFNFTIPGDEFLVFLYLFTRLFHYREFKIVFNLHFLKFIIIYLFILIIFYNRFQNYLFIFFLFIIPYIENIFFLCFKNCIIKKRNIFVKTKNILVDYLIVFFELSVLRRFCPCSRPIQKFLFLSHRSIWKRL